MPSTLHDARVQAALDRMFAEADNDDALSDRAGLTRERQAEMSARERADASASLYLPISPTCGTLLYNLVRAARPGTVVEFGTSFGISTLYLAAAVADNGTGHVVTTELSPDKVESARRTFAETGLDELITVLEGDALETLADLDDPPGFVMLDGWKNLCLPVLQLLEPRLAPGTLVVADDATFPNLKPYLDYVRDPSNGYQSVTFPVDDAMEISCRL